MLQTEKIRITKYNVKLNFKNIINTIKIMGEYILPIKKITNKFSSINSKEELQNFIQQRAAHVTQTTLYGYLKTRIGTRYNLMIEDEKYSNSINIAKWNIYVTSLSDLTLYVFSYLIDKKNLKQNDADIIFNNIVESEIKNGLKDNMCEDAKIEFKQRMEAVDWNKYYLDNPFKNSGLALYKWSPIADNLKILDKQIVLNSIKLKWNLVENDFKELTKNLKFD